MSLIDRLRTLLTPTTATRKETIVFVDTVAGMNARALEAGATEPPLIPPHTFEPGRHWPFRCWKCGGSKPEHE
jgi:hypothetical protein